MNEQDMLGVMAEETIDLATMADIVLLIDSTRSMASTLEKVKEAALSFHKDLASYLKDCHRVMSRLRIKVMWFRDFYYDGNQAFGESKWFILPEEGTAFEDFVSEIKPLGGGDDPESALEALTLAMRSDWCQDGDRRRHIIVLFSDQAAHRFEDYDDCVKAAAAYGCKPVMYPENMPKSLQEFENAWEGNAMAQPMLDGNGGSGTLDPSGRRLIAFAPDAYPWSDFETDLTMYLRKPMIMDNGGAEIDMEDVYKLLAYSFGDTGV